MEWGRVAETELMPKLVVGYTELGGSKLKKGNRFSKPNFELGQKPRHTFSKNPCKPLTLLFRITIHSCRVASTFGIVQVDKFNERIVKQASQHRFQ